MPNWEFFYFLWDDPLFGDGVGDPKDYVCDVEFIELRREERLLALDHLYVKLKLLERQLKQEKRLHRESQAREAWTIREFLRELRDVLPEKAEKIVINRKVNDMDPDFSFEQAIAS